MHQRVWDAGRMGAMRACAIDLSDTKCFLRCLYAISGRDASALHITLSVMSVFRAYDSSVVSIRMRYA